MPENAQDLQRIYARRFDKSSAFRGRVWDALAPHLERHFPEPSAVVLDLGCGYGEWINRCRAPRRHAMDLNPAARDFLAPAIRFHEQDCTAPWPLHAGSLDAIITSNFFEHLPGKDALRVALDRAFEALRPGGRLIAMGPNLARLHGSYWDFFDHHVPLTDRSLAEALELAGFAVLLRRHAFLPYTLVDRPAYPAWLVRAYLALPLAWPMFGRQFLLVAEKP